MSKALAAIGVAAAISFANLSYAETKPALTICGTTWGKLGGDHLPGQGFVPDLVMRVFRHAGYEIRTELIPWPRCVELAKRQQYDLISSAWRGENFAPHFDYLDVILHDTINFVALEGSSIPSGEPESFRDRRVGFVREAGGMENLVAAYPYIKTVDTGKLEALLRMLDGGRIDAIVSDPVSLKEVIKTMERPIKGKIRVLEPPLQINFNSPMIAKGHPHKEQIAADFSAAYRELVDAGLYDDLIAIHDLPVQYPGAGG